MLKRINGVYEAFGFYVVNCLLCVIELLVMCGAMSQRPHTHHLCV